MGSSRAACAGWREAAQSPGRLLVSFPCIGKMPGFARCGPGCFSVHRRFRRPRAPGPALWVKYQRFGCKSGFAGEGKISGPGK